MSAFPAIEPVASLLDVGGWFRPLPIATHVADLFPYETRGGRLSLSPEPGERYSRESWVQVDFLAAGFRLPFPDLFRLLLAE